MRAAARVFAAGAWLILAGCSDEMSTAPGPDPAPTSQFNLSEPVAASSSTSGAALVAGSPIVYVSLVPGAVPGGVTARVRHLTSGQTRTVPVIDGGFDPIPITARVGDEILIEVSATAVIATEKVVVPAKRAPKVVRTDPPKGKKDVPLNSPIVVVFSEPVDPATVSSASVRLLQGQTLINATVRLDAVGLIAELIPSAPLTPQTSYRLVVTRDVRDLTGEALEELVEAEFTTGSTTISSSLDGQAIMAVSLGAAGAGHTCALTSSGAAYCWGDNWLGGLGNGETGYTPFGNPSFQSAAIRPSPTAVQGGHTFASITAGAHHTCALKADGAAYCWGANGSGQLGNGDYCDISNPGSRLDCGPTVPTVVSTTLRFAAVVASWEHTCAMAGDGVVYCWGSIVGRVDCTPFDGCALAPTPVHVSERYSNIVAGHLQSCGITRGSAGYCWGARLGSQDEFGSATDSVPKPAFAGLPLLEIAAGDGHRCAIDSNGDAYCVGLNEFGQLGAASTDVCNVNDGMQLPYNTACSVSPVRVAGGHSFASIVVGYDHTCALTIGGAAFCWGANASGQLGDGTTTSATTPVRVAGGHTFKSLGAGVTYSCGVTIGGTLYCWGNNYSGQLGDGTRLSRSTPVRIAGPR